MKRVISILKKLAKYFDNLSFKNQLIIFFCIVIAILMVTAPDVETKYSKRIDNYNTNNEPITVVEQEQNQDVEEDNQNTEIDEDKLKADALNAMLENLNETYYDTKVLSQFSEVYNNIIDTNNTVQTRYEQNITRVQEYDLNNNSKEEIFEEINNILKDLNDARDSFKQIESDIQQDKLKGEVQKIIDDLYNSYGKLNSSLLVLQEFLRTENTDLYDTMTGYFNMYTKESTEALNLLEEIKSIVEKNTI